MPLDRDKEVHRTAADHPDAAIPNCRRPASARPQLCFRKSPHSVQGFARVSVVVEDPAVVKKDAIAKRERNAEHDEAMAPHHELHPGVELTSPRLSHPLQGLALNRDRACADRAPAPTCLPRSNRCLRGTAGRHVRFPHFDRFRGAADREHDRHDSAHPNQQTLLHHSGRLFPVITRWTQETRSSRRAPRLSRVDKSQATGRPARVFRSQAARTQAPLKRSPNLPCARPPGRKLLPSTSEPESGLSRPIDKRLVDAARLTPQARTRRQGGRHTEPGHDGQNEL